MSQISAEGLNHYTLVYGMNSRKLTESVVGHWCAQFRSMEDSSDINVFCVCHRRAKGYGRAEFDVPEASTINELNPKRIEDCALDAVDPSSKIYAKIHKSI